MHGVFLKSEKLQFILCTCVSTSAHRRPLSRYCWPPAQHAAGAGARSRRSPSNGRPASAKAHDVVIYALSLIDTGYRFGGKNPEAGLDCSGMVSYIYGRAAGVCGERQCRRHRPPRSPDRPRRPAPRRPRLLQYAQPPPSRMSASTSATIVSYTRRQAQGGCASINWAPAITRSASRRRAATSTSDQPCR
jgi:hypothetical protein